MSIKCFNLIKSFSKLRLVNDLRSSSYNCRLILPQVLHRHASTAKENTVPGLMEFFDDKTNWEKTEIRVGRSWRKDELRIKSNQDLHKLWFVLLKERNMLLTMEHECKINFELFPSPERLDKVHESMVNLEDVIRERNRAYFELETGETGERPGKVVCNQLALTYFYKMSEHVVPEESNISWFSKRRFWYNRGECAKFLSLYREKLFLEKKKARTRERNHVRHILKRFPDVDIELIKQEYPNVNVEKMKRWTKVEGHYIP